MIKKTLRELEETNKVLLETNIMIHKSINRALRGDKQDIKSCRNCGQSDCLKYDTELCRGCYNEMFWNEAYKCGEQMA